LTYAHVNTNALVCGLGDCQSVQASEFATIGPVPVAVLGLLMYAITFACALIVWRNPASAVPAWTVAFATCLAGAVYAIYLTWIEVAVIHAICQWCVASAILTLVLTVVLATLLWLVIMDAPMAAGTETGTGSEAY
jgi:uncharacterized membrane protein